MVFRAKRISVVTFLVVVVVLAGIVMLVVSRQESLIYFPRAYSAMEIDAAKPVIGLPYETEQGNQMAFLLLPRRSDSDSSLRLWILFGGNASLALHWLDFARGFPGEYAAFLLIDYPGYGRCEGHPSPDAIQRSSLAALDRALEHPELRGADLSIGVLGHSLGAAAALQLASQREVAQVVLLAPFSSMLEMARHTVGGVLAQFLRHRFDNRARLAEVLERYSSTRITVIHGARDEVIPVSMGRELARSAPARVEYLELPDADHNTLALSHDQEIYGIMLGRDALPTRP